MAAVLAALLSGCRGGGDGARPPCGAEPEVAEVASAFNERAGLLSQAWSRITLRIEARQEDGSKRVENTEGYLQFVRPSRVSLMVNKLGETYLVLGCDEERYWWMSLADERTALVGRHDRATPERAREFGLPMHPLDMLDLMAVNPIDAGTATIERDGRAWRVTLPPRSEAWGPRQIWLEGDPPTPVRTRILDAEGGTVAEAELLNPGPITVRQGASAPILARTVRIRIPGPGVEVRLQLHEADNRTPRPEVFDLWELVRRYRIAPERVLDLDSSAPQAGPTPPP